jgi:GT2 family glycosyltransferase
MKMSRVGIVNDIKWQRGYAPGEVSLNTGFAIQPFFTGANMAAKREVFDMIGRFDAAFKTNEDLEFCIRAVKNGWKLYFEPKAIAIHRPPRRLKNVLHSWYDYGLYHGLLFKKYNNKITEIYIYKSWNKGVYPNFINFIFKTPFNAVIFINSFHLMHIVLILAIISKILSYNNLFVIFIFLFSLSVFRYLWPRLKMIYKPEIFLYLSINYLLNLSYSLGAFIGGLKTGMFYLEATVDETR